MIQLDLEYLLFPKTFLDLKYSYVSKKAIESLRQKHLNGNLAFLEVDKNQDIKGIKQYAKSTQKFDDIVVLGIGGSALGTRAIMHIIKGKYYNLLSKEQRDNNPRLHILDNIDPQEIEQLLTCVDIKNTLFMVVSKSGKTLETRSQFQFFKEQFEQKNIQNYKENFVIIAGEESDFYKQHASQGYKLFSIPEALGGRFSALSNVGLLPLACIGVDIDELLEGLISMKPSLLEDDISKNNALLAAVIQYHSYIELGKNISVFFPYMANFGVFGQWYKQMIGESLGKKGIGVTLSDCVGVTDQHSQLQLFYDGPNDKLVMFLECEDFGVDYPVSSQDSVTFKDLMQLSKYGTQQSLSKYNKINYTIKIDNLKEKTLGELIVFFEMQTAILGEFYHFDAFDQPGVEIGKQITKNKLQEKFGNTNILSGNK